MANNDWCPPPPPESPQQDRRQFLGCIKGSLAHLKWRPLLITGMLRQILVHHFAKLENIESPDLVSGDNPAIWRDTLQTGILIESVHRWRGELVEKRPAVLVKRNAYRNVRVLINDRYGSDGQGFDHHLTLKVGSSSLFCIHGTGASCEILATEVERELNQFGPAIRQQLDLMMFQVTEVGAISEVEEATQNFLIPITIGWAYQDAWQLREDALPLRHVDLDIAISDI